MAAQQPRDPLHQLLAQGSAAPRLKAQGLALRPVVLEQRAHARRLGLGDRIETGLVVEQKRVVVDHQRLHVKDGGQVLRDLHTSSEQRAPAGPRGSAHLGSFDVHAGQQNSSAQTALCRSPPAGF
jgi:hypothetical protein